MTRFLIPLFTLWCSLSFAQQQLDINFNNTVARISSNGLLFNDAANNHPGLEVPASSGKHTIFASQLWVAGVDDADVLHLAGGTYNATGHDYFSGPLTADGTAITTPEIMSAYDHIWSVLAIDVQQHIAYFQAIEDGTVGTLFPLGYEVPNSFITWPAHGNTTMDQAFYLAPFYDYNGNFVYDPENGDYPVICGDQAAYFIINDKGLLHTETGGEAIGIEVHVMVYQVSTSNNLNNTVFVQYRVINRSSTTLHNAYLGIWSDLDIGNSADDFFGCDVERSAYYGYNGDDFDEDVTGVTDGYGSNTPRQVVQILAGPYMDADGLDNEMPDELSAYDTYGPYSYGFGDGVADNERLGMTSFMKYVSATDALFGTMTEPEHYYQYLQNHWQDGTPISYGGTGFLGAGVVDTPASYILPGSSDPAHIGTAGIVEAPWTNEALPQPPTDQRGVAGIGPFTFEPGESIMTEVAYIFANEMSSGISEEEFAQNAMDEVREYFETYLINCGDNAYMTVDQKELPAVEKMRLYPNPASTTFNLVFPGNYDQKSMAITNALGQIVYTANFNTSNFSLPVEHFSDGLYEVVVLYGNNAVHQSLIVRK